jgi:hypothetical protein
MSDHLDKIRKELEGLNTFCKHSNGISLKDYKEISSRIAKISNQLNQHQREMYLAVTEQRNSNNTIKLLIDSMDNYAMTHSEKTGVHKAIKHCAHIISLPLIPHPPSCKADFDDDVPF